jgi:hypothetical protein
MAERSGPLTPNLKCSDDLDPKLRAPAMGEETQQGLQKYLRFRHLVWNLYSDELRLEPIEGLLRDQPDVWQRLEAESGPVRGLGCGCRQGRDDGVAAAATHERSRPTGKGPG